jgi:hypothetical protein
MPVVLMLLALFRRGENKAVAADVGTRKRAALGGVRTLGYIVAIRRLKDFFVERHGSESARNPALVLLGNSWNREIL